MRFLLCLMIAACGAAASNRPVVEVYLPPVMRGNFKRKRYGASLRAYGGTRNKNEQCGYECQRRATELVSTHLIDALGVPAASVQKFTLAYCTQGQPLP